MAGNFCAQNFICSLVFTKEISLRIDFENLRHPKRVWTYDFKGRRPSSFFFLRLLSPDRPKFLALLKKQKKVTT